MATTSTVIVYVQYDLIFFYLFIMWYVYLLYSALCMLCFIQIRLEQYYFLTLQVLTVTQNCTVDNVHRWAAECSRRIRVIFVCFWHRSHRASVNSEIATRNCFCMNLACFTDITDKLLCGTSVRPPHTRVKYFIKVFEINAEILWKNSDRTV